MRDPFRMHIRLRPAIPIPKKRSGVPFDETAIEDARQFLEPYVRHRAWKGDPTRMQRRLLDTINEVKRSDMSDGAKQWALWALAHKAKKRESKPTRHYRDIAITRTATRLVRMGYKPTRNESTDNTESASSIIRKALNHLGVKMKEKQINTLVLKYPLD